MECFLHDLLWEQVEQDGWEKVSLMVYLLLSWITPLADFLKTMKLWKRSRWCCKCFSVMTRLLKICSIVLRPGLKPAWSSASSCSALDLSQLMITWSMWDSWFSWWYDSSYIAWGGLSMVKIWQAIVSTPSAIPMSLVSSGISLLGLLLLSHLHS